MPDSANHPTVRLVQRRELLKTALGMGLSFTAVERTEAQEPDPPREGPQENDLFVFAAGEREGEVVAPADIPLGGPPVAAFPLDPRTGQARSGSRLNLVVLIRLDPRELEEGTSLHSSEGIIAYSAVCTHTACDISEWKAEAKHLLCPCHGSEFDVRDGARVVNGPAPRRLAALPLKLTDGRLTAAGGFAGRVGYRK